MDFCDLNIYKVSQFYSKLDEKEFILYDLSFAETFENMERVKIPNSFNVNRVDEITDISFLWWYLLWWIYWNIKKNIW